MHEPLLRARDIKKYFPVGGGLFRRNAAYARAVDGIELDIAPGETLGLVGESGSGKSDPGGADEAKRRETVVRWRADWRSRRRGAAALAASAAVHLSGSERVARSAHEGRR